MKSFPERNMFRFLRYVLLFLCIVSLFCAAACGAPASDHTQGQGSVPSEEGGQENDQTGQGGQQGLPDGDGQEESDPEQGEEQVQEGKMYLKIGETVLTATLADNEAARELAQRLPLTLDLRDYGGFEKVGSLGFSLPRADASVTTQPGEFVLYQGNQFVLFYGQNTWSYTRLGRIDGMTAQQLQEILGGGNVTITLSSER